MKDRRLGILLEEKTLRLFVYIYKYVGTENRSVFVCALRQVDGILFQKWVILR